MNIKDELLRVIDVLTAGGIEYAIAGGLALAIHGRPRLTVDIDILIRSEDLDRARSVLAPVGFDLESGLIQLSADPGEGRRLFRLAKTEGTEFLTLELLLLAPGEADIWAGRERFELGDRQVWVVSREALVKMKRSAGRPQDLADIAALESEPPG